MGSPWGRKPELALFSRGKSAHDGHREGQEDRAAGIPGDVDVGEHGEHHDVAKAKADEG